MAKVVIRSGSEWVEVIVDGEHKFSGHSMPPRRWREVLRACGVEVDYDNDGDFCACCQDWTKKPKKNKWHENVCPECYDKHKDE